jgi:(2R)-3-sulfolactate dehydrogenase (NADP+)
MPVLSLDAISDLALGALTRAGAGMVASASVARSVVRAEADGIGPVGLGYLPTYLAHLRSGRVSGTARPIMTQPRPAVVTVDAADGFAHPALDVGIPPLVTAARSCGVATLAVTRSYSAGVLGHVVEDVADHGLIALGLTNSPPNMTAWEGRRKVFGTNPIAFACPRPGLPPLVVDQATSVVTKVALVEAAARAEPISEGWAFDAAGRPTTDPQAALAGSMAPAGGAKGANIALLVEVLAAVLTGATLSKDVVPYAKVEGPPAGVGQFIVAIDPGPQAAGFDGRLADLLAAMVEGSDARVPGDRRLRCRERAARDGVVVDARLVARIAAA